MYKSLKILLKILGSLFVLMLVAILCSGIFLSAVLNSGNHNDVISTLESDRYTVYLFNRDFGVATGFNNQIYVAKKGRKLPDKAGNVFTSDDIGTQICWIDEDVLLVRYQKNKGNIYKMKEKIYDLTVKYEAYE